MNGVPYERGNTIDFLAKRVVVENGLSPRRREFLSQIDPRPASGVMGLGREPERFRKAEDAKQDEMKPRCLSVEKTSLNLFIAEQMAAGERLNPIELGDPESVVHHGVMRKNHLTFRRGRSQDLFLFRRPSWNNALPLLMEIGRVNKEFGMLNRKRRGLLDETAFSKQQHVSAGRQCVEDNGPFFQCEAVFILHGIFL